jgi:hypothetical protein
MSSGSGTQDGDSQKLAEQRARAQELRDRLNETARQLAQAGQAGRASQAGQAGRASQAGRAGRGGDEGRAGGGQASQAGEGARAGQGDQAGQSGRGDSGRAGQGQQGGGGSGNDLERLREQYRRQLQDARDFMDQMRRDDPSLARGGGGFTFEAADGRTSTAPGTEAFKQDFGRWEDLRRQATQALEQAESSLSKKLQAKQAKDRLAAGTDDKAPAEYQKQVDSYFKAIAGKKKP